MRKTIILFIILCFISCKKNTEEIIQYDKNGNVISKNYVSEGKSLDSIIYIRNGKIDSKFFFKKNSKTECYVKYYDEMGLESEGNTNDKKKIGIWKYYYLDGKKIVEYKIISNKEYPNQVWTYNTDGKLNLSLSSFYTYKFEKESLLNGVKVKNLRINYIPSRKNTICTINLSQKINHDYSNINSVEKFTLKSDSNYVFNIPIELESLKKKRDIKGYIDEHYFDEKTKKLEHSWKRTYVNIPTN